MKFSKLEDTVLRNQLKSYVFDIIGCCQAVHREKGPELSEYVYQECLQIAMQQENIPFIKEYFFHPTFRGIQLHASLRVDFFVKNKIFLECKAIEELSNTERIQLTNYMRNAGVRIGILYNFFPEMDECEKFYYDPKDNEIYYF